MPRCPTCGAEVELLDPTFRRPEAYARLAPELRETHARADDDLCRIAPPGAVARYFVRGVLPVPVAGQPAGIGWGLWAEVSEPAFERILALWSDPEQSGEPPLAGALANAIPSYPDTLGLPLSIHLTGPTSRPEFHFRTSTRHPFVSECEAGVDAHRAVEWSRLIHNAP